MSSQSASMIVAGAMAAAAASLTPLRLPEKVVTMSRQIVDSFSRWPAIASAALVVHIGCAAAAMPQSDFQRQVSAVLAGNIASHSLVRASSLRDEATGSRLDSQQFVRQLLLGGNAAVSRRASSAAQGASSAPADEIRQDSPAHAQIQIEVQQLLLGVQRAGRGVTRPEDASPGTRRRSR